MQTGQGTTSGQHTRASVGVQLTAWSSISGGTGEGKTRSNAPARVRLSCSRQVKEAVFSVTVVRHGHLRQSRRCMILVASKFAFWLPLHGRQAMRRRILAGGRQQGWAPCDDLWVACCVLIGQSLPLLARSESWRARKSVGGYRSGDLSVGVGNGTSQTSPLRVI